MNKSLRFPLALIAAILSFSAQPLSVRAEAVAEEKKSSPFLIEGQLPHPTKTLMSQWENPKLKLSPAQKERLLVVRKETMDAVKKISPKIAKLEKQIVEGILTDKTPAELTPLVKALAELKATATQIHLRCIYDTREVLTPYQSELLETL